MDGEEPEGCYVELAGLCIKSIKVNIKVPKSTLKHPKVLTKAITHLTLLRTPTLQSPHTVIRLVELPIGGNWMNVALSFMIDLRSSIRSVSIQSNFRGRIAVSFEMSCLFWWGEGMSGLGE